MGKRHQNGLVHAEPWERHSRVKALCTIHTFFLGGDCSTSVQVLGKEIVAAGDILNADEARTLAAVLLEAANIAEGGELPE